MPNDSEPTDREKKIETVRNIGALSTVGFSFALAVLIGAWVGWLFDRWFGTSPILFIAFFFLGMIAGMINVFRSTKFMK